MNIKKIILCHLNIKLFLAFLIVVVVGAIVLITAVEFIMPIAFENHLEFMQNALNGNAKTELGMNDDLFISFRTAVYNAMKFAIPSSIIAALIISLTFTQQFINQIKKMLVASRKISNGNFQERIALPSRISPDEMDELQQLAVGFNQMTEKLDKNEILRRELIGDVSHELRTPLAFIKASIESIADGIIYPSPEALHDIQEEIDRLTRLVDDLQELSIIEAGSYVLNKENVPIEIIITPLVNQIKSSINEKGIQFKLNASEDLPVINVDVDRIKQVLTNIFANAIRFTPQGGRIELNINWENDRTVKFSICDSGIGILGSQLDKIFTRFYRVDKSRSRESGGSGIGLTIARQLIEAHGGRIWAESPGNNKGTIITFTLPIA